jgi:hypothetical protein
MIRQWATWARKKPMHVAGANAKHASCTVPRNTALSNPSPDRAFSHACKLCCISRGQVAIAISRDLGTACQLFADDLTNECAKGLVEAARSAGQLQSSTTSRAATRATGIATQLAARGSRVSARAAEEIRLARRSAAYFRRETTVVRNVDMRDSSSHRAPRAASTWVVVKTTRKIPSTGYFFSNGLSHRCFAAVDFHPDIPPNIPLDMPPDFPGGVRVWERVLDGEQTLRDISLD